MFDLKQKLYDPHEYIEGFKKIRYGNDGAALVDALKAELKRIYDIKNDFELHDMHKAITKEKIESYKKETGHWLNSLDDFSQNFKEFFYRFVYQLSHDLFGTDVYFEKNPLIRYHIPGKMGNNFRVENGEVFAHHSDNMLGDYFEQINMWLPFCNVQGSSALAMVDPDVSRSVTDGFMQSLNYDYSLYRASRRDFFEHIKSHAAVRTVLAKNTKPCDLKVGEILLFDPRVLHGTQENATDYTRVSMDFRILPVSSYQKIISELDNAGIEVSSYLGDDLVPGGFFHEKSAHALYG